MATAKKNTKPVKSGSKIVASKGKFSLSSLQKKLIAIAAVVVLGAGGFWLYNDLQDGQLFAASCVNTTYRQGSKGTCVRHLQTLVSYFGGPYSYPKISVDGVFGSKTTSAVKSYQKIFGLSTDGVVGKKTWSMLCSPQKGYMDSKGVAHGVWSSQSAYNAAKAAGCNMKGVEVIKR